MSFIYYPPTNDPAGLHPEQLRHRYFAQVGPDGSLVPGVLHQGKHPRYGKWIDVAGVKRGLPKKYFVKTTPYRTLVPGSLIEADHAPEGRWKEVRKSRRTSFHRAFFPEDSYQLTAPAGLYATIISTVSVFNQTKVLPVLQQAFPDIDFIATPYRYYFHYYFGDFDSLDNDATKLELFMPFPQPFTMSYFSGGTEYTNNSYLTNSTDTGNLRINSLAQIGTYSLAISITINQVKEYVFFDKLIINKAADS